MALHQKEIEFQLVRVVGSSQRPVRPGFSPEFPVHGLSFTEPRHHERQHSKASVLESQVPTLSVTKALTQALDHQLRSLQVAEVQFCMPQIQSDTIFVTQCAECRTIVRTWFAVL